MIFSACHIPEPLELPLGLRLAGPAGWGLVGAGFFAVALRAARPRREHPPLRPYRPRPLGLRAKRQRPLSPKKPNMWW